MSYAVSVDLHIHPEARADFLPLMRANAQASLQNEPGCLRFDICTDPEHADLVYLYELYTDRAAFEAHLSSPHYASFNSATADMIAQKSVRTFRDVMS